jgi:hypothetical protein
LEDYVQTIYFIANPDWNRSFKNKLDIKSRTLIEEKVRPPLTHTYKRGGEEKEFVKKEESRKDDLEDMRLEMEF